MVWMHGDIREPDEVLLGDHYEAADNVVPDLGNGIVMLMKKYDLPRVRYW